MSKYLVLLALLPFLLAISAAQDPTGMETDFENGMIGWSGDGMIVLDETRTNKVYSLRKSDGRQPSISYTFTVPKNGRVRIRFRVRGMNGGEGLKLRKAIPGSSSFGHEIEPNDAWVNRTHGCQDSEGIGPYERTFSLILFEGMGEIQIDDIQVSVDGTPSSMPSGELETLLTTKEEYWRIGEDAAILIPAGWKVSNEGLPAPLILTAEGKQHGISVIQESPQELATTELVEYAKLKAKNLSVSFPGFQPSDTKAGEIGDLPAIFFQGPATIEGLDVEVKAMAVQGKEEFYLIIGVLPQGSEASEVSELMRLLRTFKEHK